MLRDYQRQSVEKTWDILLRDLKSRPLIVLPTGAGKSHVLAALASDAKQRWGVRTLVLTHVKELVQQNADKLRNADHDLDVGVYSAGLNSRDTHNDVIVASVQSVFKRIAELSKPKPFSLIIIDEAHLIPPSGDGMYRTALEALEAINPKSRLCGLTATPFRTGTGSLVGDKQPFSVISHEVGVRYLIDSGYLCRPVTKGGNSEAETSDLHIRQGEFIASEMSKRFMSIFTASMNEMFAITCIRKSILVFCSSVEHAMACWDFAQGLYYEAAVVTGTTPHDERDEIIRKFRDGEIRYLFNVNVLTTGFDAPNCDAVVLLRSTMSPGLYCQMVGRGFRLHSSKSDFLVLDFGQNVSRHGCIDQIKPAFHRVSLGEAGNADMPTKKCPACQTFWPLAQKVCEECGHKFEFKPAHEAKASDDKILSEEQPVTYENLTITDIEYQVWYKRGAGPTTPRTMRVTYYAGYHTVSEWICIEHEQGSFARNKAEEWWKNRSQYPFPRDAEEAVFIANSGGLKTPEWVRIKNTPGERWQQVESCYLGLQDFPVAEENFCNGGDL